MEFEADVADVEYKEEGSVGIIALGSISVRSESLHYASLHPRSFFPHSVAPMSIFRVLEDSNWQPSVCENVVSTLFAALHYYNSPFVGVSRCLRNTIRVLLNNPFLPLRRTCCKILLYGFGEMCLTRPADTKVSSFNAQGNPHLR